MKNRCNIVNFISARFQSQQGRMLRGIPGRSQVKTIEWRTKQALLEFLCTLETKFHVMGTLELQEKRDTLTIQPQIIATIVFSLFNQGRENRRGSQLSSLPVYKFISNSVAIREFRKSRFH